MNGFSSSHQGRRESLRGVVESGFRSEEPSEGDEALILTEDFRPNTSTAEREYKRLRFQVAEGKCISFEDDGRRLEEDFI